MQAAQNPVAFSLIPDLFPANKSTAMAAYNCAIYLGRALSFGAVYAARAAHSDKAASSGSGGAVAAGSGGAAGAAADAAASLAPPVLSDRERQLAATMAEISGMDVSTAWLLFQSALQSLMLLTKCHGGPWQLSCTVRAAADDITARVLGSIVVHTNYLPHMPASKQCLTPLPQTSLPPTAGAQDEALPPDTEMHVVPLDEIDFDRMSVVYTIGDNALVMPIYNYDYQVRAGRCFDAL